MKASCTETDAHPWRYTFFHRCGPRAFNIGRSSNMPFNAADAAIWLDEKSSSSGCDMEHTACWAILNCCNSFCERSKTRQAKFGRPLSRRKDLETVQTYLDCSGAAQLTSRRGVRLVPGRVSFIEELVEQSPQLMQLSGPGEFA